MSSDGRLRVNSEDIAEQFGKRHDNVLRDIDSLVYDIEAEGSSNLSSLMFQEVSTYNERANRETRRFEMDRDGFSLLVMGWTGERALRFKLA